MMAWGLIASAVAVVGLVIIVAIAGLFVTWRSGKSNLMERDDRRRDGDN